MTRPLQLPYSRESERTLLGGVLLSARALPELLDLVAPSDFYDPTNAAIWSAMGALAALKRPVDAITVADQLRSSDSWGPFKAQGGEEFFGQLVAEVVTIEGLAWHAERIARKARARKLMEAAQELVGRGYAERDADDLDEQLEQGIEKALSAAAVRSSAAAPEKLSDLLAAVIRETSERAEKGDPIPGISTGYRAVDERVLGWGKGELIVLAGRPAMGKTAFAMGGVVGGALGIADQHGRRETKDPVAALVFSREMTAQSLAARMLASEAQVDGQRLRAGRLTQVDWIALAQAASRLATAPIFFDEVASTWSRIRATARRWRAKHRGRAQIVIDYAQLVEADATETKGRRRYENREQEISAISRGAKGLAKELDLPVVLLSQLNRAVEQRQNKRPQLSDLRESGAIEQDADVVAFLYRDEVYNENSPDKGTCEVIFGKQRNGPVGMERLAYRAPFTRFEDIVEEPIYASAPAYTDADVPHWSR